MLGVIVRKGASGTRFSLVQSDEIQQYVPWSEQDESHLNELLSCSFAQHLKTELSNPAWKLPINKGLTSYSDLFTPRQKLAALKYMGQGQ